MGGKVMRAPGYPATDLLVDSEWLGAHLADSNVRVVDMDQPAAYQKGHIPGAVGVPDQRLKSAASPIYVLDAGAMAALMTSLGIGDETLVVAYDSGRSLYAARLWWVLSYYGHTKIRVLNGGWRKWCAEGRPIEVTTPKAPAGQPTFTPQTHRAMLATLDDLLAAHDQPGVAVWDIRSRDEFTGATDRGNARRGHVPGARHLEWSDLVNEAGHTFKNAQEMRRLLAGAGITPDKTVHIH
jgi:thiosulfate/3-mercaptopyruvate sulfurtransferase